VRFKVDLGIALIACMIATAALFAMPPVEFLKTAWHTNFDLPLWQTAPIEGTEIAEPVNGPDLTMSGWYFFNKDSWQVLLLVTFILVLSKFMKESGALDDLTESVRNIFVDNRFVIGALPALIGLLPMPGGALISAPMIEPAADEAGLSADDKTYLNYWFRHVWEYSYPLYPGLILLAVIVGIDISRLVTFMFPLSMAALLGGALFGLLQIPKHFRKRPCWVDVRINLFRLLRGFWPVITIFIALLVIKPLVDKIGAFHGFVLEFIYVLVIVVPLFGLLHLGFRKSLESLKTSINWQIVGTIYAVLVFKDIINNSGAATELSDVLTAWGVPPLLLFMLLPLIIGYLNGITHAYVSVAILLLMPFLGGSNGEPDLAKVQLAYAFGFIGVLYSPVHLCLALSIKYFNSDMNAVYRKMTLPVLLLALVSLVIYFAWG